MEITPTTLILVGLVCVVLGFIASLLLNTLQDDNGAPVEGVDQTPPGGRKGRYTSVARLWRERGAAKLVVEMDGRSFLGPEALDAAQRERLEHTARELRGWLGMGLEAPASPPAQAAAAGVPGAYDLNRAVGAPPAAAQTPVVRPQPVRVQTPPPPVKAPTLADAFRPKPVGGKDEAAPAAKSIVMQIEDILQDMIAGTPMEARGVHLTEDPARGVVVQVGLDFFDGIDAVTDPEVKATIRQAVQTWESTQ
jgi:hypothetical protein